MSKRKARVPATYAGPRARRGWHHWARIPGHELLIAEDERLAAALPIPGDAFGAPKVAGVEVRRVRDKRGGFARWEVWFPNQKLIPSAIEVYAADGTLKDVLMVHGWSPEDGTHEPSRFEGTPGLSEEDALEEALAYAKAFGIEDPAIVRN